MNALRIQMFGPFQVWRQGRPVADEEWPTQKSRALVKILLNERGHLLPADRLIEYLWPDLPVQKAQNNLWVTVSQARRVLEPELTKRGASTYILRSAEGYSFNISSDYWLDVDAFLAALQAARKAGGWPARLQALEAARALYSGEYLEEEPYEDWAIARRDELRESYLSLLTDLADAHARLGRYRQAISLCREILAQDRAREPVYQNLMIYHYSAGEQPQALKIYEECRLALQGEMGVEPAPATRELYQQIGRRQLEAVDSDRLYPPPDPEISEERALAYTEFVGRRQEYDRLVSLADGLLLKRGQTALIEGEAGIGKSRLVQEVLGHARERGLNALVVGCYQIEQSTPFQPILELIDQAHKRWSDRLFEALPAASLAEIAALYPEAARLVPNLPSLPAGLDEARQARLFKALTELLIHAAGGEGLVLLIDDIHWADHATLRFIHHLARQAGRHPLLLILTYRGEEAAADEELGAFVHSLKREPRIQPIHLNRLTLEDIQQILKPMTGSEESRLNLARWLHQETDGNPFFAVTILQSLVEQGLLAGGDDGRWGEPQTGWLEPGTRLALPEALLDSVRDRLRRVPPSGREILELAAVIGRRFEFETLERIAPSQSTDLLIALEELLRRRLLRENEDGRHYDFSHDKIREVVYRDMSQARRAYLHCNVAAAIEQQMSAEDEEYTGTLAEHYAQGRDWTRAIHYMGLAGDRSRRFFAIGEALGFYDRAIRLADEHPEAVSTDEHICLHQWRGETRMQAGEFESALADLKLALETTRQAGDLNREQTLLVTMGILYRREDLLDPASEYLNQALEVARRLGDQRRVADTLYHLGTAVWSLGENSQAETYHQEAVGICRSLGLKDLVAAQALHGLGETRWISGDFVEAFQLFHESMELCRVLGDRGLENENLHNLGALHSDELVASYRKAQSYLQEALKMLDDTGLPWHRMPVLFSLGLVTGFMGDYERGLRLIQQALEEASRRESPRYYATALDFLGCLYRDLNLLEQAEAAFLEGLETVRKAGLGFWMPRLQANLAITRIRRSDLSVKDELLDSLNVSRRRAQNIHVAVSLQGLAELSVATGDFQSAAAWASELIELAELGMREALVQAYHWRGKARLGLGDRSGAEADLLAAAELAGKIEKPRLAWEIHSALERAYTGWGEPETADLHRRSAATARMAILRRLRSAAMKAGLEDRSEGVVV